MDYFDKTINIGDEIFCEEDGSWGDVCNTYENGDLEIHFESGLYADQTWIVPEETLSDRYDYYVMSMKAPGVYRLFKRGIDYKVDRYDQSTFEGNKVIFWNIVTKFLDSINWPYDVIEKYEILNFEKKVDSKVRSCLVNFLFDNTGFNIIVLSGLFLEEETRGEISEFLLRANHLQSYGNFEITENGEIISSIRVNSYYPNLAISDLWDSLIEGWGMFETFGNGIITLSLGYSNAIDEIEKAKERLGDD